MHTLAPYCLYCVVWLDFKIIITSSSSGELCLSLCQTKVENILLQTGLLASASTPHRVIETPFPPLAEVRSKVSCMKGAVQSPLHRRGPCKTRSFNLSFFTAASEAISNTLDSYRGVMQRLHACQKTNARYSTLMCICRG